MRILINAVLLCLLVLVRPVPGQEKPPVVTQETDVSERETSSGFTSADIEAAKRELAAVSLRSVSRKYTEMKYPIAYVIGNAKTGERRTFFAIAYNREVVLRKKNRKPQRKIVFDHLDVLEDDIQLTFDRWNWRNTGYAVSVDENAADWVVLANLYPSFSAKTEDVYVPYSPQLHEAAPDLIDASTTYLDEVYQKAVAFLEEKDIAWRFLYHGMPGGVGAHPLLRIADDARLGREFLQRLVKAIIAIEHIDHDEFRTYDAAWLIEKVLVTIGANRATAYNFAISSAQAGGLAQFIAETYQKKVRGSYPEAKLVPDFMRGMRDHVNAVAAMILLIDHELAVLAKNETVAAYLDKPATSKEQSLADEFGFPSVYAMKLWLLTTAAYNGGTGTGGEKIARAIRLRGEDWFLSVGSRLDALRDKIGNTRSQLRRTKEKKRATGLRKELSRLQAEYDRWKKGSLSPQTGETPIYLQKSLSAYAFFSSE